MKKWMLTFGVALFVLSAVAETNAVVRQDLVLPEGLPGLAVWTLGSAVLSVGKWMSGITVAVQIIKWLAVLFGAKLPPHVTAGVVALVTLLTGFVAVGTDGTISGGRLGDAL